MAGDNDAPACPKCSSDQVLPIVYGRPGPELFEQAKRGEVALGGCMVDEEAAIWCCQSCGHEFGKLGET
jgi:ribosomal protein L37AE/L43A